LAAVAASKSNALAVLQNCGLDNESLGSPLNAPSESVQSDNEKQADEVKAVDKEGEVPENSVEYWKRKYEEIMKKSEISACKKPLKEKTMRQSSDKVSILIE